MPNPEIQTDLTANDAKLQAALKRSEQSIARNSAPVKCPDFTRGKWKTRKPVFAK